MPTMEAKHCNDCEFITKVTKGQRFYFRSSQQFCDSFFSAPIKQIAKNHDGGGITGAWKSGDLPFEKRCYGDEKCDFASADSSGNTGRTQLNLISRSHDVTQIARTVDRQLDLGKQSGCVKKQRTGLSSSSSDAVLRCELFWLN